MMLFVQRAMYLEDQAGGTAGQAATCVRIGGTLGAPLGPQSPVDARPVERGSPCRIISCVNQHANIRLINRRNVASRSGLPPLRGRKSQRRKEPRERKTSPRDRSPSVPTVVGTDGERKKKSPKTGLDWSNHIRVRRARRRTVSPACRRNGASSRCSTHPTRVVPSDWTRKKTVAAADEVRCGMPRLSGSGVNLFDVTDAGSLPMRVRPGPGSSGLCRQPRLCSPLIAPGTVARPLSPAPGTWPRRSRSTWPPASSATTSAARS